MPNVRKRGPYGTLDRLDHSGNTENSKEIEGAHVKTFKVFADF